jgi:tetratricopeptide (TPR) repeat protein
MKKRSFWFFGIVGFIIIVLSGCGGFGGLMKAELKMIAKDYEGAIPIYEEYLSENPTSIDARNKLGFVYLKTGKLDKSIKEFETVLKAKPGNPQAVLYLGMAYINKGRSKDAIITWQGFGDEKQPLVEDEIRRLLTLVQIAESHRSAQKAIKEEAKLMTVKPDTDTVTVGYYQDLSPDKSLRAFQKGLASMVITDLSKIKSVKVVERLQLQALLKEMKLGLTGIVDARTAPRVGRLLGAENMVVGNLTLGSIQATSSFVSTSTGKIRGSSTVSVDDKMFYDLPIRIVRDFVKIKGIKLTPEEKKAIGTPHTKNYKAFIYYGQALDALDEGRWQDAKDLFDKAVKEDPRFALAAEGSSSCPGANSPGIDSLKSMTIPEIATMVETAISMAQEKQSEVDAKEDAEAAGGGGY